ncbi:MAG: beta-ketoacyl-ACP synthase 3 [Oscillospiraceae bacterium]|jgi:3-oxoacyl-[acyl-carrier-protein] synthase-3|nr:beta-ketoacyl-ACP synthase 3 [Oscillospiraceae bacterium]
MPGLTILGTGSYSPPFALTNEMLESIVETSGEWITLRTGIAERKIAAETESTLSMATAAALKAIGNIDKASIGLVVCATITPDYITPSLSCLLQRDLELREDILAIDINCACSGYVTALKTAHSLLADMPGRVALILGCEMLTRITDYTDRTTCILFGDGAGAAVIRRDSDGEFSFDSGAKGSVEMLACKAQYISNNPFMPRPLDLVPAGITMNGQEVFRFAIETCSESVKRTLAGAGVDIGSVEHFIFHQANRRIIDGIVRKLGISTERCLINIATHGNTSSATCAIALDDLFRSGKVKRGDKIIMSAFGGGLTYATAYFVQNREI